MVDRRAADVGVGVGEREGTSARLDEGDVGLDQAVISRGGGGAVADRQGDGVGRAVDDEAAGHAGDVRVIGGQRARRLGEAVEVEHAGIGGRDRPRRREDVGRAEAECAHGDMGAAGVGHRAREGHGVQAALGQATGAGEAAEDLQHDATGVDFVKAGVGGKTARIEAAVALTEVQADEGVAVELEADAAADRAEEDARVTIEQVIGAQPTFDAAAVEVHGHARGRELVGIDLEGRLAEFDRLPVTGAVDAPAFRGTFIVSEGGISPGPARRVDVEDTEAVDGDRAGTEGTVMVHLDGAGIDGHRTVERRGAVAPDEEHRIAPLEEAAGRSQTVVELLDGKAGADTGTLVEAFDTAAPRRPVKVQGGVAPGEEGGAGDDHQAATWRLEADTGRHEAGGVGRVEAEVRDLDRAVIGCMIHIDTGLVLDEDRAERVTRGEHRGRVGVETEHGHGLLAAIHADQRIKLI